MDYFISVLKQNGIYVNLNLLAGRKFVSADGLLTEIDTVDWSYQHFIAIFHRPMIDLQKEFAQQLLTHINPYTGVSYA